MGEGDGRDQGGGNPGGGGRDGSAGAAPAAAEGGGGSGGGGGGGGDGGGASLPRLLRALPLADGDVAGRYGCGLAEGACLETVVVRRPPALVHLYQAARLEVQPEEADGATPLTPPAAPAPPARPPEGAYAEHLSAPAESLATARLAVAYHSLGNRTDAETAGRALALAVDPGEEESPGFVPRAERAAAAWTADADAGARREVVEPDGTTRFLDVGDNYNFYYQF